MSESKEQTSLKRSRALYKKKDRETIARHYGIEPTHPVLDVLLAFCVQWGLDPLSGHVWLVDDNFDRAATDGEPAKEDAELKVAVTRDGFLAIAHQDPSWGGMIHDAVHAKDTFKVKREGGEAAISHEYPDMPGAEAEGNPEDYRGAIIGAYAQVYVKDRKPSYYFAWMKEHGQFKVDENGERIFEGSWTYTSGMIIKSAQSVALRFALGITGVVGIDEIRPDQKAPPPAAPDPEFDAPADFISSLVLPEDLQAELLAKVEEVNASVPNSWSLAKLRMRLTVDADSMEEAARRVVGEVDRELKVRAERGNGAAEGDVTGSGGGSPAEESVPAGSPR